MIHLGVNIDHVATVRQARRDIEPDPVAAAVICELAGAHGITVHLRSDRRHIQDRDLLLLRQTVKAKLNMEMGATDEMVGIAIDTKPDQVTLVPEKREELTTEGGLDVVANESALANAVRRLKKAGIPVSMFIEPDCAQIEASGRIHADAIELHTGLYANAKTEALQQAELERLVHAGRHAVTIGLRVHAGHGLTYRNVIPIKQIPKLHEVNIGHNIVARAVLVGLDRAVREMLELLQ
ncbi:MAG: pyridoxine 5'-phosphate synthase [Candidatus Abyssobacteria bacterium SURF_5]|uniref:Pyridoxine 5'-phosphate synthase n=1 Tax=Abyssobacteria bacterium (strain SURF_5) TaxID=2093360 RepID=A0A3A4P9N5_ABYX5|nr:MAG: pyridoxine 5'-phosphate synthase [Candidatus Abyssubacteria bacterium SURF_5]